MALIGGARCYHGNIYIYNREYHVSYDQIVQCYISIFEEMKKRKSKCKSQEKKRNTSILII